MQYPVEYSEVACQILIRLYEKQREARRCQKLDAVSCYDALIARFCHVFPDAAAKAGARPPPRLSRPAAVRPHAPLSRVSTVWRRHDADAVDHGTGPTQGGAA
jgi:hypothetical protein